jgi:hypothetical protein
LPKDRSYSDEALKGAIEKAVSWTQVSTFLGSASGSVIQSARKRATTLGFEVGHLEGSALAVGPHRALVPTRTGSTIDKGHATVAVVTALLTLKGFVVVPALEGSRYDLLLEQPEGRFLRLQCKTGRLRDNAVQFHTRSQTGRSHNVRPKAYTKAEIDYFAVFCVETGSCYLVPVQEASVVVTLRLEPPANGQIFASGRRRMSSPACLIFRSCSLRSSSLTVERRSRGSTPFDSGERMVRVSPYAEEWFETKVTSS